MLRKLCWRVSASSLFTISSLGAKYEARVRYAGRMVTTDAHDDSSALSQLSYVDPFVSMRCIHEEEAPIGVDNVSPVSSIVTFAIGSPIILPVRNSPEVIAM